MKLMNKSTKPPPKSKRKTTGDTAYVSRIVEKKWPPKLRAKYTHAQNIAAS